MGAFDGRTDRDTQTTTTTRTRKVPTGVHTSRELDNSPTRNLDCGDPVKRFRNTERLEYTYYHTIIILQKISRDIPGFSVDKHFVSYTSHTRVRDILRKNRTRRQPPTRSDLGVFESVPHSRGKRTAKEPSIRGFICVKTRRYLGLGRERDFRRGRRLILLLKKNFKTVVVEKTP